MKKTRFSRVYEKKLEKEIRRISHFFHDDDKIRILLRFIAPAEFKRMIQIALEEYFDLDHKENFSLVMHSAVGDIIDVGSIENKRKK